MTDEQRCNKQCSKTFYFLFSSVLRLSQLVHLTCLLQDPAGPSPPFLYVSADATVNVNKVYILYILLYLRWSVALELDRDREEQIDVAGDSLNELHMRKEPGVANGVHVEWERLL